MKSLCPTVHIEAKSMDEVAKHVIMPGDPLRAQMIANNYLDNVTQFNSVRGINGYTGFYKNARISIMASGMGIPSMAIYSYELFCAYGVESIIRVGTCGSYHENFNVYDVAIANEVWTESTYSQVYNGKLENTVFPSQSLNSRIIGVANDSQINLLPAKVHCTDAFYFTPNDAWMTYKNSGFNIVDMESYALLYNAKVFNKNAACIFTVSDSYVNQVQTTSIERQNAFTNMVILALNTFAG